MSKHRITIELNAEQRDAISSTMDRKDRNIEIADFCVQQVLKALPELVAKERLAKADEFEAKAAELRATVRQQ